jgi:hypothetical protein
LKQRPPPHFHLPNTNWLIYSTFRFQLESLLREFL